MNIKPFDEKLNDKYDDPAKNAFCDFLRTSVNKVTEIKVNKKESERDYSDGFYDVLYVIDGMEKKVDVEVKSSWKSMPFPFPTVHIPARKVRHTKEDSSDFFVMFSESFDCFVVIPLSVLKRSEIITKDCYNEKNGSFAEVRLNDPEISWFEKTKKDKWKMVK